MSERLFDLRKQKLLLEIENMENFLSRQKSEIAASPFKGGAISHLNTRLFLQVHVTNVIEASQEYDQAVTAYLAAKQTERQSGAHN